MYDTPASWLGKALATVPKIVSQVAVSLAATVLIAFLTNAYPALGALFRPEPPAATRPEIKAASPAAPLEAPAAVRRQGLTWFGRPIDGPAGFLPLPAVEPSREPVKAADRAGKSAQRKPRPTQAAAPAEKTGPEVLPVPRPARPAEPPPESEPEPTLLGMPLPGLHTGRRVFRMVASLSGSLIDRITP
jgi:hypothetical protein